MKKVIYLLSLIIFLISCSEEAPETQISRLVEGKFIIDGKSYAVNETYPGNVNCNSIFININLQPNPEHYIHRVKIELTTDGHISGLSYFEGDNHYIIPNYDHLDHLIINDFKYENNIVIFNFSASLFEIGSYNYPTNYDKINISARIKIEDIERIECFFDPTIFTAEFEESKFRTNNIWYSLWKHQDDDKNYYYALSDDGFFITMDLDSSIHNMPVGNYFFDENSIENFMSLKKFIGPATGRYPSQLIEEEWEEYKCEGGIFIGNHSFGGFEEWTTGSFYFKAYKNEEVVYTVENGYFKW